MRIIYKEKLDEERQRLLKDYYTVDKNVFLF